MSEDLQTETRTIPEELIKETKEKPKRTEAQIRALELARKKANEVRAKNAEDRKKSREIERAAVDKTKRENSERIQREYEALHKKEEVKQEEEEIVYEKAPKKKRSVVVVQQTDSSDSEVEVKLPKLKPPPKVDPEKANFDRAYAKMFQYYD